MCRIPIRIVERKFAKLSGGKTKAWTHQDFWELKGQQLVYNVEASLKRNGRDAPMPVTLIGHEIVWGFLTMGGVAFGEKSI